MISIALIVASWIAVSVVVAFCVGHAIKMADLRSPGRTTPATVDAGTVVRFPGTSETAPGLLSAG